MSKILHCLIIILLSLGTFHHANAQPGKDSISLKKGEVFDILLLRQNPGTQEDLKSYFQSAVAVGKRMTYQSLSSFKISEHLQGNHEANLLILAKWSSLSKRKEFSEVIVEEVPDFHERRRKIWSYFGLKFFELEEDVSFVINRDKYHVATAYWFTSPQDQEAHQAEREKLMAEMNGEILVQLSGGETPQAYRFDPDLFIISAWESEAAFRAFQEKSRKLSQDNIHHVNEFILK